MPEKRLLKDADKVDLTDLGETSLHSHAGGGGSGLVDKSGTVTTNGQGVATITFITPYGSTDYFFGFGIEDPGDACFVMLQPGTKVVDGFDIKTWDDGGKTEGGVVVTWHTGLYSNP